MDSVEELDPFALSLRGGACWGPLHLLISLAEADAPDVRLSVSRTSASAAGKGGPVRRAAGVGSDNMLIMWRHS